MELMWCIVGEHEVPRTGFTRPASRLESTEMCNPCYFQGLDQEEQEEESDDDIRSRQLLAVAPREGQRSVIT